MTKETLSGTIYSFSLRYFNDIEYPPNCLEKKASIKLSLEAYLFQPFLQLRISLYIFCHLRMVIAGLVFNSMKILTMCSQLKKSPHRKVLISHYLPIGFHSLK